MRKINYNGSISDDLEIAKTNEYIALGVGAVSAAACAYCFGHPDALLCGPLALGQVGFGTIAGTALGLFGFVKSKKAGAKARLNSLLKVTTDLKDVDLKRDVKVVPADVTVPVQGREDKVYDGEYILIQKSDYSSSVIREYENEKREYVQYLMNLKNQLELDITAQDLVESGNDFGLVVKGR